MTYKYFTCSALIALSVFIFPEVGFCDIEGTLGNIRDTLIHRLIPLLGALGICWASLSFFAGNPNAKNHLVLAIVGAIIGFTAPSIITYVQGFVH